MRVVAIAVGALSITLAALATAGGCGLDPTDLRYTIVDAGMDVSSTRRDSGGLLDGETSVVPDAEADAAVDAGDADASDASVDTGPCPAQCSSCPNGVCQIDCPGPNCTGNTITCPNGRACRVICSNGPACASKGISCPLSLTTPKHNCSVICEKTGSCKDTNVSPNGALFCFQCVEAKSCESFDCGNSGLTGTCTQACASTTGEASCSGLSACGLCSSVPNGICP